MSHLIFTTQVMPVMVIHSSPIVFMSWLKTEQAAAFVTQLLSTALSKLFAKKLATLAFPICAKKHLPKPSVWHSVLTLL